MKRLAKTLVVAIICIVSVVSLSACDWFINPRQFSRIGITIDLDSSFIEDWEEEEDDWGIFGWLTLVSPTPYCYFSAWKDTIAYYEEGMGIKSLYNFAESTFFSEGSDGAPLAIQTYEGESFFYYSIDLFTDEEGDDVALFNIVMKGEEHYYIMSFCCFQEDFDEAKFMDYAKTIRVV